MTVRPFFIFVLKQHVYSSNCSVHVESLHSAAIGKKNTPDCRANDTSIE